MGLITPDVCADLVPGYSGAGFRLGESLESIEKRLGVVQWFENDCNLQDVLSRNSGWVGVISKIGQAAGLNLKEVSFSYMNDVVSLFFEEKKVLYRILVGKGYLGSFRGVKPGGSISELSRFYRIDFNCEDDEFLVVGDDGVVGGVSFITDYRASLECVPEQEVQYISIHDWALR
ncbi:MULTISPECIES: hypothetical protein [unclassified Pseudomonas]|uniref:hypothetical protein n=1 Tax=unclassified Pseudomonas TaxID=196821 RepID=UPI00117A5DE3|nr:MULTISPECIES: hypothetical protein [unclassified Pseudomonas]